MLVRRSNGAWRRIQSSQPGKKQNNEERGGEGQARPDHVSEFALWALATHKPRRRDDGAVLRQGYVDEAREERRWGLRSKSSDGLRPLALFKKLVDVDGGGGGEEEEAHVEQDGARRSTSRRGVDGLFVVVRLLANRAATPPTLDHERLRRRKT